MWHEIVAGANGNRGLLYSENSGRNWLMSDRTIGSYTFFQKFNNRVITSDSSYNKTFYSDDKGQTWNESQVSPATHFFCMVESGGALLAGGAAVKGIFKSVDGGASWVKLASFPNAFIFNFCVIDGTIIGAGGANTGIIYSNDGGNSWNQGVGANPQLNYSSLTVSKGSVLVNCNGGIFYSDDKGQTWTPSNMSQNMYKTVVFGGMLITFGLFSDVGIWWSVDNGKNWQQSDITTGNFRSYTVYKDTIFVAGEKTLLSSKNGISWTMSNINNSPIRALFSTDDTIFASTDNKIWYSVNDGATWVNSPHNNPSSLDIATFYNFPDPNQHPSVEDPIIPDPEEPEEPEDPIIPDPEEPEDPIIPDPEEPEDPIIPDPEEPEDPIIPPPIKPGRPPIDDGDDSEPIIIGGDTDIIIDDLTGLYNIKIAKNLHQRRFAVSKTVTLYHIIDQFKRLNIKFIGFETFEEYFRFERIFIEKRLNLRGVIVDIDFLYDMLAILKRNTKCIVNND